MPLLLQLLNTMLLIIDDSRREGPCARHSDMGEGDEERMLFMQRDNVTYDATFIAGLRQI